MTAPCGVPVSVSNHLPSSIIPALSHFHQEFFVEIVEKALQVHVEHPVHFLPLDANIQCVERLVLAASGTKPVGETPKVFLVNLVEDLGNSALDDLVFQRRESQRS